MLGCHKKVNKRSLRSRSNPIPKVYQGYTKSKKIFGAKFFHAEDFYYIIIRMCKVVTFPIRQRLLDHRHYLRSRRATEPRVVQRMGFDELPYPIAMDEH